MAANAMLSGFHNRGEIDNKELVLSSLLNSAPVYIKEVFTYQLPVIMPALGWRIGLVYLLTFWLSGLAKLMVVIFVGRKILQSKEINLEKDENKQIGFVKAFRKAIIRQKKFFIRLSLIFVCVTFLVFFLMNTGVTEEKQGFLVPLTQHLDLPPLVIVPLAAYIASPLIGIASIGALVSNGGISEVQAITALLFGGMFMLPVLTLRSTLPRYSAIFGFKLGGIILAVSTGISIHIRGLILSIFLIFIT